MAKQRVAWISILQAIAIIAVMIGHVDVAGDMNPDYPVACWLDGLQAFQMPVFFFISGFLYVRSSLFKKNYMELVKSKWKRLIVPFLFMSFVMWGFKLCLNQSMLEHPVSLSWSYFMNVLFAPWDGPIRHLWFVESLLLYFLLTPLYKWTLNSKYSVLGGVMVGIFITFLPSILAVPNPEVLTYRKACAHFVYFYLGMVVMKFDLVKYVQNYWALVLSPIIYYTLSAVPSILPYQSLWIHFVGIPYILSLSWFLSERWPNLLSNVGKYSYQIYLLHMLPIMVWKFIFKRHQIGDDTLWFSMCWIGSLLSAVCVPILAAKIAFSMSFTTRISYGLISNCLPSITAIEEIWLIGVAIP